MRITKGDIYRQAMLVHGRTWTFAEARAKGAAWSWPRQGRRWLKPVRCRRYCYEWGRRGGSGFRRGA